MNQFQHQQENQTMNPSVPPSLNHGAHEIMDVHELLSFGINTLNQYTMMEQQCTCQELRDIIRRQHDFMTQEYNTLLECFSTGTPPQQPTGKYEMKQGNNVIYGLEAGTPKKPIQSANEWNNENISQQMMGLMKTSATETARAACEITNPVVRRVVQDSVANCLEMAYEIFLYQNKKGYYQVPQLPANVMQQMIQSYQPSNATMSSSPQAPVQ